ncbi:MAG: hypothetical protein QOD33_590 [Pyrinomonadaceae bacterium]|nr:hypothetical protein [Pyrinomonadaceae bacterium]
MPKNRCQLSQPCIHHGSGRRDFFMGVLKASVAGAVITLVPGALVSSVLAAPPPNQNDWRLCRRCRSLFYNGFPKKGVCPARGRHDFDRVSNYKLTYNSSGPGQRDWRFCNKCFALFFDGYQNKGRCPAGDSHVAQGFNFSLRSDNQAVGQREWRFCNKCEVMFFNRDNDKGICTAGGGHVAAGYVFILDNSVRFD